MAPCKRTLILPAGAFRRPAAADELLDEPIAVIALDLDAAVAARAPGAAQFLEFRGERIQFSRRQSQAGDDRHAFALAALGLAADAHGAAAGGLAGCASPTNAFADRALTIGTALADVRGIDDTAAVARRLGLLHERERTRSR